MKTAMEELINELKYQFSHSDNHLQTIVNIVQKAEDELFEKEKEQIKDAFKYGWNWNYDAEKYYNETYNNEKT